MTTEAYSLADIKIIIGLGNPGGKFARTRHNAGFMLLDRLVEEQGKRWTIESHAHYCTLQFPLQDGSLHTVELVKPQTFMNCSGRIAHAFKRNGIEPGNVLVVHDELEKKFGYVGRRCGGSARGHNGLRSLIEVMGFDFWRIRIGIGRPAEQKDIANYVLERFGDEEMEAIPGVLEKASGFLY